MEDQSARSVAAAYETIEKLDGDIQAFVPEPGRRERLEAAARSIAERWPDPAPRPPLYGIPVGIKDIVRVDGLPTRAGSAVPPDALAGPQAPLVDRLLRAGAIVAGKTATAEFAVFAPGPTRNPRNLAHTPGGSSSGSAAAVAAGMVPLAIGTQTIGSVIRPAAYCGVVGFKPTYGRIPTAGVIANAPALDTIGLFANDVAAAETAAGILCDEWRSVPVARPVLGIPVGPYLERASETALSTFGKNVTALGESGYTIREVSVLAEFDDVAATLVTINRYELAQTHAGWFAQYGDRYRTETAAIIRAGQQIDRIEYEDALRRRTEFRQWLLAAMASIDLWIAPAATGPAPRGLDSTGDPTMSIPWNLAGLPCLAVPAGAADNGLPLGLQCVAAPGADEQLLQGGVRLAEITAQ